MTELDYDCLIIGGGAVGLLTALTLSAEEFRVAVIDRDGLDSNQKGDTSAAAHTLALSQATIRLLRRLEIWDTLAPRACPINAMRVVDTTPSALGDTPRPNAILNFEGAEKPQGHSDARLGAVIESRFLTQSLLRHATEEQNITLIGHMNAQLSAAQPGATRTVSLSASTASFAASERRKTLHAPLIIAADGGRSRSRAAANIKTIARSYGQAAIIARITHPASHENTAWQDFLPEGPCALLPLCDEMPHAGKPPPHGAPSPARHCSALVWTLGAKTAATLMQLSSANFCTTLSRYSSRNLGGFELSGSRKSIPLDFLLAQRAFAPRLVLVGDAAHHIHPLAGQGFNLAVKDIAVLRDVLVDARYAGGDIGAEGGLARYDGWRRSDILGMSLLTHGLNGLFAMTNSPHPRLLAGPVAGLRRAGLAAVNRSGPLKALATRVAAGQSGALPRLLQ